MFVPHPSVQLCSSHSWFDMVCFFLIFPAEFAWCAAWRGPGGCANIPTCWRHRQLWIASGTARTMKCLGIALHGGIQRRVQHPICVCVWKLGIPADSPCDIFLHHLTVGQITLNYHNPLEWRLPYWQTHILWEMAHLLQEAYSDCFCFWS